MRVYSLQTVCSMHQVYIKFISLAVESMAGSKWVGFDADTIRRIVNNAVYMFLIAMELKCAFTLRTNGIGSSLKVAFPLISDCSVSKPASLSFIPSIHVF